MGDSFTTLNPGSGGNSMDEESITYGSAPVTRQRTRVQIGGSGAAEIARVLAAQPADTDYGLVTRRGGRQFDTDANNTTTTPLVANQTFTGTGTDIRRYVALTINLFGAPRLTAPGTLYFEFSPDNTNWDVSVPIAIRDLQLVVPIPLRAVLPFFRVRYVNGATIQTTFRLTTCLHGEFPGELIRTPTQIIGPQEPVQVVRALIEPGLNFGQRRLLGADRGEYGAAITTGRVNHVQADFSRTLTDNDVTQTVTGTGAISQASGQAQLSTGVGVLGASAKLVTNSVIDYQPYREVFCNFTARFTTPGAATEEQRAGLYDANNGFFLGYHGTVFGFTQRSAGVDTFTALTAANGDPVDGSGSSRFTRAGLPEALDPTKLNVWRINFGWDSAVTHFEVMSPDGEWMLLHTIAAPNLTTGPSIQNPNLPITFEATKATTDATLVIIGTGSWAAGVTEDTAGLAPSDTRSRIHVDAVLDGATLLTAQTMYTVPSGHTFYMTAHKLTAGSTDGNLCRIRVKDNTTVRLSAVCTKNNSPGALAVTTSFPEPVPFTTSVVVDQAGAALGSNVTASVVIVGYLERS